jgi:hypothetical protein
MLKKIDFLGVAPHNFIFQNNSNKTNFGGLLTLIFMIITLIIIAFYLIDFITEQTYSVEYVFYEELFNSEEILNILYDETRYNPYFEFVLDLKDVNDTTFDEDFVLINYNDSHIVERGKIFKEKITNFDFYIAYKCNDGDEDCIIPVNKTIILTCYYNGFILDHQNEDSPLYQKNIDKNIDDGLGIVAPFSIQEPSYLEYSWKWIKYKKEAGFSKLWNNLKGIDDEKQKIIGLTGNKAYSEYLGEYGNNELLYINETGYRAFARIKFVLDFNHYDEYNRVKKNILNYLSNICSLCLTIFNCLSLFLAKLYSNNFDNYKIVEKILFNSKDIQKEKIKKLDIINSINKEESLLPENQKEIINIKTKDNESDENIDKENYEYNINNGDDEEGSEYKEKTEKLPKFRFIDFILNNIYRCNCCKSNKQKIIETCNELIKKYYSVDTILYNQLKLTNLLKDYKWNNQELSNFKSNELIIQLKHLISYYDKN